jgi:uncharacterized protein (DUF58 family)
MRRLDWRVLARTDRPYVREYDEETNLRCAILLDCSGSMGYRGAGGKGRSASKFEYSAKLVASLAYLMLGQTESVGLGTFRARMDSWLAPHGGSAQLARVIDVLERATPAGRSDSPASMVDLADRLAKLGRRGLVVMVSDFFADVPSLRASLARLRHGRHEVIGLRVLDDDEIEFPFRRWLRLRGMEAEGARLVEPALARQRYLENFAAHAQSLHEAFRASGAEFHTFRTGRPLPDALIGFLRHRVER